MESLPMKEELLKGLNEEQIAKVKACKSQEEMLALAKEEGFELTDEQLEAVSGGSCGDSVVYFGFFTKPIQRNLRTLQSHRRTNLSDKKRRGRSCRYVYRDLRKEGGPPSLERTAPRH